MNDVLMLVCDGLKGLPEAVEAVWPRTIVQTCVVHLLRNSFRSAARQDWDKIARLLKGQARWTMRWKTAPNSFDITFDERLSAAPQ
ncbi:transposase-like protein [Streptomyces ambofaciens]